MCELLLSMFGFLIIFRILSLLEKFSVITRKKMISVFILFQVPLYFFIFFKELFVLTWFYIGIFLTGLIFFNKILSFCANKTFQKLSIQIIDELVLLMKTGKSAQASLKMSYMQLSNWEKIVFKPFLFCFDPENSVNESIQKSHQFYFDEMKYILRSTTRIIDQLCSFREGMKVQRNLRHRSGQVTKQIRAQAVVALFIYIGMFLLSWHNFDLSGQLQLVSLSILLFLF